MSFCNANNGRGPGAINGNALTGINERVCIQVKKVFDAALKQFQENDESIKLSGFTPPNPTFPLTFVSCKSSTSKGVISGLSVEKLPDKPRFSRVQCAVAIPVECVYVDDANVEGVCSGNLNANIDIIMCVPEASIIPYEFEAVVSAVCPKGVISGNTAGVDACITIITKIVVESELLIPAYGYCPIPQARDFASTVCNTFFELPLYPANTAPRNGCNNGNNRACNNNDND